MQGRKVTYESVANPIHYVVLFGERTRMALPMVPPAEFSHPFMSLIGHLPHSLAHFGLGIDCYGGVLTSHLQVGYDLIIVYADSFDTFHLDLYGPNDLFVFLVCTSEDSLKEKIQTIKNKYTDYHALWVIEKKVQDNWKLNGQAVSTEREIFEWLMGKLKQSPKFNATIDIPIYLTDAKVKKYSFIATQPNQFTLNAIEGNWGFDYQIDEEKALRDHKEADDKANQFARQSLLVEQLNTFQILEHLVARNIDKHKDVEDCFNPPLIMSIPYNSGDIRHIVSKHDIPSSLISEAQILSKLFDYEYSKNYIVKPSAGEINGNENIHGFLLRDLVMARYRFTDFVAMLHCSIRFSPYLRLPTLGVSISTELSYVAIKNYVKIWEDSSKRNVIAKVGRKLSECALSDELASTIANRGSQIVAMSDLPVEWMMVNGVPLAFTHDVCRLPEMPITSMLSQYVEARYFASAFFIPEDIIKKTLVVFGCEDEEFKEVQKLVIELQRVLGFTIRTCLSNAEFENAIKEVKPELLIVDTHGGLDETTKSTYLVFGNEHLYGDYIVTHGISAPLIFLSACNTFPTFNTVSSIANAFFEAGSNSVTTSYLPVPIFDSTILYVRLLNMLNQAATNGLHCNWLSFVSHIMRTSFVQEPLFHGKGDMREQDRTYLTKCGADLMIFRKRREIYHSILNGDLAKYMKVNYQNILPNYLLYSTLGRADLIRFDSYVKNRHDAM